MLIVEAVVVDQVDELYLAVQLHFDDQIIPIFERNALCGDGLVFPVEYAGHTHVLHVLAHSVVHELELGRFLWPFPSHHECSVLNPHHVNHWVTQLKSQQNGLFH